MSADTNPDMSADIIADIVTFWLRDSRDSPDRAFFHRGWWYEGSPVVDEEIRTRFDDLVPRACAREFMIVRSAPATRCNHGRDLELPESECEASIGAW